MGTFWGHALPGTYLIIYALWWTIMASIQFAQSKRRGSRFKSTASFTVSSCCGRVDKIPLECVLKFVFPILGILGEVLTGMENGRLVRMGNAQHATMFFFFIISGIVDLLMFFRFPLPPNTDYISLTMAFMVEGLLFTFHLHGRSPLDVLVHTLLLYTIYANIIAVIVEMMYRHTILSPLCRAYFVLLQGTWFWQLAFILYNPTPGAIPWKPDDHDEMTLATLLFAWHALADFIVIVVITVIVQNCCYRLGKDDNDHVSFKRLLHPGSNGTTVVTLHGDSESELEMESFDQ